MEPSAKPRQYLMTSGFDSHYGSIETMAYVGLAHQVWKKYPVDMVVFENSKRKGFIDIKAHGYHADTNKFIDKKIMTVQFMDIKKFWLKYDNYGDHWVGTFLFPEEY